MIRLPWSDADSVVEVGSGRSMPAASAEGMRLRGVEDGRLAYKVGSRTYQLRAGDATRPAKNCG